MDLIIQLVLGAIGGGVGCQILSAVLGGGGAAAAESC